MEANRNHMENDIKCENQRNGSVTNTVFIVVPNTLSCLLGLKTIRELASITVNSDKGFASISSREKV